MGHGRLPVGRFGPVGVPHAALVMGAAARTSSDLVLAIGPNLTLSLSSGGRGGSLRWVERYGTPRIPDEKTLTRELETA
jgi:hypothetical protein